MPNKDGTGPQGKGPKTGRQMGNCGESKREDECLGCGRRNSRRGLFRRGQRN